MPRTLYSIQLTTDTDTNVAVALCTDNGKVFDTHIIGGIKFCNGKTESMGVLLSERIDVVEAALVNAIRNAAILWKGCNDRLDRGERDSLAQADYEAICETIRDGIAALLQRNPQRNYNTQKQVERNLRGGIITDLVVSTVTV